MPTKRGRGAVAALPSPPAAGNRRSRPRHSPEDDVRATAAWVVDRTLASLSPADAFLAGALERYESRDQALLRELALGTLRWLRRIDDVLGQAASRKIADIEPDLRAPLRVAIYQLLFLDRIPAHAAVNEAVERARQVSHRGGVSFVNAVLRRIARSPRLAAWPVREADPIRRLAVELSHPDFLVRRWVDRFGESQARALLIANNQPRPLGLLAFRDRGGRELLAEALIDEGLDVEPSCLSALGLVVRAGNPLATEAFSRGDFYIQDEASQVAALLPPPRPGERIFDVAAAPGGKSLALLAWEPTVRLVAADVALSRLGRVRENLRRLGRTLPLLLADAARPALGADFDRVVVDLPCTGTGTLRKHPELKWRISDGEIGRLARQSLDLLSGAGQTVRPGGWLIAVTCSLEWEENEAVVESFLDRHPDFEPADLRAELVAPLDRAIRGPGCWQLLTGGDHDGFTVHVLRRTVGK